MNLEAAILHLRADEKLRKVIQNTNIAPLSTFENVYYDLLNSIASQQLSVQIASIIFNRFCNLFPDKYPKPELVDSMDIDQMQTAGLSRQKAAYMKNVAVFALENNLKNYAWEKYSDAEIIDFLTQIKGVGRWTAEMILMFTLGREDIFPVDDLGIQQAMTELYNFKDSGKQLRQKMTLTAADWQPYRTLACRYLWQWKNEKKQV